MRDPVILKELFKDAYWRKYPHLNENNSPVMLRQQKEQLLSLQLAFGVTGFLWKMVSPKVHTQAVDFSWPSLVFIRVTELCTQNKVYTRPQNQLLLFLLCYHLHALRHESKGGQHAERDHIF